MLYTIDYQSPKIAHVRYYLTLNYHFQQEVTEERVKEIAIRELETKTRDLKDELHLDWKLKNISELRHGHWFADFEMECDMERGPCYSVTL